MTEGLANILSFTIIPCAAIVIGSAIAVVSAPGPKLISAFQHFAAGVVFSAVAVELMPELTTLDSPIVMIVGFVLGVGTMLAAKTIFENAGIVIPMSVDLFIDGLLVAVGFAAGTLGGFVLLIGLTLETFSLGLSTAPTFVRKGMSGLRAILLLGAVGLTIFLGVSFGHVVAGLSGHFLAGILGFGVAALLFLVTEELLVEAHQVPDTNLVTATFFAGFLIPIIIAAY